ncbi:MAG: hypothetical protein J5725_08770 [Bacteroidales bacterium]|nr:hypothetical protein [Bacteroidales bacterium]
MSKCDKCEARIYFARVFDIHIEQDDCPYDCMIAIERNKKMKLIKFLLKRYLRKHPEWLATTISVDERTDINIIVAHYHEDYWTYGTKRYKYENDMSCEIVTEVTQNDQNSN